MLKDNRISRICEQQSIFLKIITVLKLNKYKHQCRNGSTVCRSPIKIKPLSTCTSRTKKQFPQKALFEGFNFKFVTQVVADICTISSPVCTISSQTT